MNGALYISFFQGQLESALEQVVQLAVTEITDTVGASLSSMLLETARKEQENQRLRTSIQSPRREEAARGESADPEPQHGVPRPGSLPDPLPDSLRHEQKRRAVGKNLAEVFMQMCLNLQTLGVCGRVVSGLGRKINTVGFL